MKTFLLLIGAVTAGTFGYGITLLGWLLGVLSPAAAIFTAILVTILVIIAVGELLDEMGEKVDVWQITVNKHRAGFDAMTVYTTSSLTKQSILAVYGKWARAKRLRLPRHRFNALKPEQVFE